MSIDRWDPFRDMMTIREAMDRWLQQGLSGTGQLLSTLRPDSIPIDVIEHEDSYEVRASVPGVKPEDVEVVVQGERVTIRAEVRASEEQRGDNWLMREHRFGTLQRSITSIGIESGRSVDSSCPVPLRPCCSQRSMASRIVIMSRKGSHRSIDMESCSLCHGRVAAITVD